MPIFQDHFLDNRHGWPVRQELAITQKIIEGDYAYVIDRKEDKGYSIAWKELEMEGAVVYKAHAVIQRVAGGNHAFGLIWRGKDRDNCYSFEVATSGYFKIKHREGGQWSTLVDWQQSDAIKRKNSTNELMVEQLETRAIFFVNGQEVYQMDLSFPAQNSGFGFVVNGRMRIRIHSTLVMDHIPRAGQMGEAKAGTAEEIEEALE